MKLVRLAVLFVASVFASTAFSHGSSSYPKAVSDSGSSGSVISAEVAPRAIIWHESRLWQRSDGIILVCPFEAVADRQWNEYHCYTQQGKVRTDRWTALQNYQVAGMMLKSYEYRFVGSGGSTRLIAYYGPATDAETAKELQTGPITIKTDKVVVQRRTK